MGLTVTIATTIEFFVFPFLAAWGFALCMWQLYMEAVIECFQAPSAEKVVDCVAYLCAAAGTTLLAIAATFPPSAPVVLPVAVVLCLCAGVLKAGQFLWAAGKQICANEHAFFSQSTDTKATFIELQPLKTQTDWSDDYGEGEGPYDIVQNDNSIDMGQEGSQSLPIVTQQEGSQMTNDDSYIESPSGNDGTFKNITEEESIQAVMTLFRVGG
ncbi:MAG: hypothetical protein GY821_00200 [Gammaproteobacteria bacterium]|nr:hypothetical protein [Gammaproteobacteria bacterium]